MEQNYVIVTLCIHCVAKKYTYQSSTMISTAVVRFGFVIIIIILFAQ